MVPLRVTGWAAGAGWATGPTTLTGRGQGSREGGQGGVCSSVTRLGSTAQTFGAQHKHRARDVCHTYRAGAGPGPGGARGWGWGRGLRTLLRPRRHHAHARRHAYMQANMSARDKGGDDVTMGGSVFRFLSPFGAGPRRTLAGGRHSHHPRHWHSGPSWVAGPLGGADHHHDHPPHPVLPRQPRAQQGQTGADLQHPQRCPLRPIQRGSGGGKVVEQKGALLASHCWCAGGWRRRTGAGRPRSGWTAGARALAGTAGWAGPRPGDRRRGALGGSAAAGPTAQGKLHPTDHT